MRWGALVLFFVLCAPASALAAQQTSLESAADGTLTVVGSGWRPAEELVVSLGTDQFLVYTDSSGAFELQTQLVSYEGALSVRHAEASMSGSLRGEPHPLAVLFVQSMAQGAMMLVVCGAALAAFSMAARALARKRR